MNQKPISDLRRRMLEDMAVRRLGEKTQHDYIKHVETFAIFLGRSPDTATAEDLRRFQVHEIKQGSKPPKMNTQVSALRFFLKITLGRLDLAHQLARVDYPRKLPRVLSLADVARLLEGRPWTGLQVQGRVECGLWRRTALRRGCCSARERYRQRLPPRRC
jgi:integrase/recombinase XerD